MNTSNVSQEELAQTGASIQRRASGGLVIMGVSTWLGLTLGFAGLRLLLQDRPQFVGQPLQHIQARLLQESPRVQWRKASEDVALVHPGQPSHSEVLFDLRGHRDTAA